MSLRKCPYCEDFHRGRCVVCRPCARKRLISYTGGRLRLVSYETFEADFYAEELATAVINDMAVRG